MTVTDEHLSEVRSVCPGAALLSEGGVGFVDLPALKILVSGAIIVRDALLSLGQHTGYASRLYLSEAISGRGQNWTSHVVFGRTWHTPSWNGVLPGRPAEMLLQHLKMYR